MTSALARPTLVVVASLLVHRATANNDDDDDESNEHLSYSVWIDRCEARARGENRGEAPAAERLDVAGAGPRGADGAAEGCLDVAGAPGDGPGRPRRADGGAEATVAAVTYRVKSDFCPTLFTRLFLITRPEDMHVSHPLVGPHTPQLTAVKTKAA